MPLGGGLTVAISLGIGVAGLIQKGKAAKVQQQIAQQQIQAQEKSASENDATQAGIASGHDSANILSAANTSNDAFLSSIIDSTINSQTAQNVAAIQSAGAAQAASINKQGNILLLVAGGVGLVSLTIFIINHKAKILPQSTGT